MHTPAVYLRLNSQQKARFNSLRRADKAARELTAFANERPAADWPEAGTAWDWGAWEHMLCTLCGELSPEAGPHPFNLLYQEDDWLISYVQGDQVAEVAQALAAVDPDWFRERHAAAGPHMVEARRQPVSLERAWHYLEYVRGVFERAAAQSQDVMLCLASNRDLRRNSPDM